MTMNMPEKFGAEGCGRLTKVMLHCPTESIKRINDRNLEFYLFDRVPDYDRYIEEHNSYRKLLESLGIEVYELSELIVKNRELMTYLSNLAYLNDSSVVTSKGALVSCMCPGGRQYEELAVKEALSALGIPILYAFEPGEQFEGFLALSSDMLFVADTQRHSKASIERFFTFALQHFQKIIYAEIPQQRRFMHPDMVFGLVSDHIGLVYPPAFLDCWLIQKGRRTSIDFMQWMKRENVELIRVTGEEQQKWATSFITSEPGHIVHYDISLKPETKRILESNGVRFTQFHPDALLAGGGSLRCLTLALLRE